MKSLRTSPLLGAALLGCAALALGLAGCQQASEPAPQETEVVVGGPDAKPGISGSDGRLVLPVIAGRPAAVYFTVRNDGRNVATLAGVFVTGAGKAEMHETKGGSMGLVSSLEVTPGAALQFAPGGLHVMAFELADTLKAGQTTELTLTFADGDKLSMPLKIETMGAAGSDNDDANGGGAMGDMPGMHH